MSPGFVLLLIVVVPSAFVLGVLVGWNRGREAAEDNLAATLHLSLDAPATLTAELPEGWELRVDGEQVS